MSRPQVQVPFRRGYESLALLVAKRPIGLHQFVAGQVAEQIQRVHAVDCVEIQPAIVVDIPALKLMVFCVV